MTVPWVPYKSTDLRKGRHWNISLTFRIIKILTLLSEDSWPASTSLLWLYCLPFRIFQRPFDRISKTVQPTDKWSIISWRHMWEGVRILRISFFLSSAIHFTKKGLKWFGQDQGLLIQALKRVGTHPVILAATVNWRPPCSHLLSNMCSLWLPLWRS